MEILIAAVVLAVGLVAAAALLTRRSPGLARAGTPRRRRPAPPRRRRPRASPPPTRRRARRSTTEDGKSAERRADLLRLEERLRAREEAVESRLAELGERERKLADDRGRARRRARAPHPRARARRRHARLAGRKAQLLKEVEDQIRHDRARVVRQIEEETKRDADRRVRNILSVVMQRLAAGHAAETTVSVVQLSADDMKGRIIGREGRNIRALEHLTGVDFIIDDTPNAVILSGFDGVRREIARMTLEKLLQDGRIHPARIEETYYQAKSELEAHIAECGEQACFDANVQGARRRADDDARPAQVPHLVRPERARALDRVRPPRRDDGRRARRLAPRPPAAPRCCTTSARPSRTRSRARTRWSAATSPAATASPRPSPTRWRPTTTRSSRRPSRP